LVCEIHFLDAKKYVQPVIGSGGAVLSIVGLFVIVLVWCLPQALMSAELALLTNSNGGAIVWCVALILACSIHPFLKKQNKQTKTKQNKTKQNKQKE
jgi:cellobiose-specific phosphotransferase system component IIC